jgi:hypothetical protein
VGFYFHIHSSCTTQCTCRAPVPKYCPAPVLRNSRPDTRALQGIKSAHVRQFQQCIHLFGSLQCISPSLSFLSSLPQLLMCELRLTPCISRMRTLTYPSAPPALMGPQLWTRNCIHPGDFIPTHFFMTPYSLLWFRAPTCSPGEVTSQLTVP